MNSLRPMCKISLAILVLTSLIGCDGMQAVRSFNSANANYEKERFEVALDDLRDAAEKSSSPTIAYNFAITHWALIQHLSNEDNEDAAVNPKKIGVARLAIADALESFDFADEYQAKLIYCDAEILRFAGQFEEANERLRDALSIQEGFQPALARLIKSELPVSDGEAPASTLLLLVLADVEEPVPIDNYYARDTQKASDRWSRNALEGS